MGKMIIISYFALIAQIYKFILLVGYLMTEFEMKFDIWQKFDKKLTTNILEITLSETMEVTATTTTHTTRSLGPDLKIPSVRTASSGPTSWRGILEPPENQALRAPKELAGNRDPPVILANAVAGSVLFSNILCFLFSPPIWSNLILVNSWLLVWAKWTNFMQDEDGLKRNGVSSDRIQKWLYLYSI